MRLGELVGAVDQGELINVPDGDSEVISITRDSREVQPGSLFFCVVGSQSDGHEFAANAVKAGAVVLVCERQLQLDVPQLIVKNVAQSIGLIAAKFFGNPQNKLSMLGVTGTNGKTTTTCFLKQILISDNQKVELIGTLNSERTTPDAIELFGKLRNWVDEGVQSVVMEVSSHALVQGRVNGIVYKAAAFTNLSQDHLDYHKDMEDYFAAKAQLFTPEHCQLGIVNVDDEYGKRLTVNPPIRMISFSLKEAKDVSYGVDRTTFVWEGKSVSTTLPGEHNVYNALTAATIAKAIGIDVSTIAEGISALLTVPGRMERIDEGQSFLVFVDYAHTPDGLEHILQSASGYAESQGGRLICVFGCGGDRDQAKRPLMGKIASEKSDLAVLTSDNPRSEDPMKIINDALGGIDGKSNVIVEADRQLAIQMAIDSAKPNDVVVIAGKGHEPYQEINGERHHFDDREEARAALHKVGVNS